MLCVCLSFPITELCLLKRRSDAFLISAFLADEEQALTGGIVCFKHCLTNHSVFNSNTLLQSLLLCSTTPLQLSWFVFVLMFCYQMYSFPVLRSVMGRCKRKNEISYHVFFFKEAFKAIKIHCRENTLWREAALWYWAVQMCTVGTFGIHLQM